MKLTPKNWTDFQHYNKRTPPWIKLHRELLDNFDYQRLPIASKALAPMLWLIASEHEDGEFDGSMEFLAFRLRWDVKDMEAGLKPLIDKGFFIASSGALAERYQDATPEGEAETETEAETEGDGAQTAPPKKGCRIPESFPGEIEIQWAKANEPAVDAKREAAKFRDYWKGKSGKDATKADWPATWRNWIRKAAEWRKQTGDDARNDAVQAAKAYRRQRNG